MLAFFLSVSLALALDICLLVLAAVVRVFALFARLALLSLSQNKFLKNNRASRSNVRPGFPKTERFA